MEGALIYEYIGVSIEPDLTKILEGILNSDMDKKCVEWCRWDQDEALLKICFTDVLDVCDKTKLDFIVSNSAIVI